MMEGMQPNKKSKSRNMSVFYVCFITCFCFGNKSNTGKIISNSWESRPYLTMFDFMSG
jgi:hypothetical protein